jgi:N-acetylglucosaminyl-diphospho-decaprenol L-rhamnosyltransferase
MKLVIAEVSEPAPSGQAGRRCYARAVPAVDVVIVSYNSSAHLRACVEPLVHEDDVRVIVVDNASSDESLATVEDLGVLGVALPDNRGFAHGCNEGWTRGNAPFVLLLNPDAHTNPAALHRLLRVLEEDERVGAAAPRILDPDGALDYSQRRFPRLVSTYAQAVFLHRLFPAAEWTDEVVRDPAAYARRGSPDWVSGACLLVRRSALEELGGLDAGFFMYGEDIDLCRRLRDAGYDIVFEPDAVVIHEGGASALRPALLPVLAASRIRYAQKHAGRAAGLLERVGVGLGALTHIVISRGGAAARAGHARSLRLAFTGARGARD